MRQLFDEEQGLAGPAAAHRRLAMSQYCATPQSELPRQGSPTCAGPHVPAWLMPPSVTTTRFRQTFSPPAQERVLLQACPVMTEVKGWHVRSASSHDRLRSQFPNDCGSHG